MYEPLTRGAVAAVMPTYGDVPPRELVEGVLEHVGRLVLVDDGSGEDAARQLEAIAASERVDLVRLPRRQGKGSAIRAGVAHLLAKPAAPQAVLLIDADGQHPVTAIAPLLAAGRRADVVIGDRFDDLAAMPWARRLANLATQRLFRLVTGCEVRDTQNGLRLLRASVLETLPPGGYDAETRHLKRVLADGLTVVWTPMPAIYGDERSSFRTWRDGARVLWAVVQPVGRAPERYARAGSGSAAAAASASARAS